jgi:RNA polymerase sigma factor (sigma-70 family)
VKFLRSFRPPPALSPAVETGCLEAFEREIEYLYWTLVRFGARRADVEDLLQDVFVALYRKWETLDTTRSLRPWLFGAAFRVMQAHRRRRTREQSTENLEPVDPSPDPETWLEANESLTVLAAALERVPVERRSVLVLHDLEGVEVVDLARKLSLSKSAVYARLDKARKELATAVRELWWGERK